jgi:hypothetical protein
VPISTPIIKRDTIVKLILFLLLWAFTIWLMYPLIVVDDMNTVNAKDYFYRSVIGIGIMIILFGKTVFDLFFPLSTPAKSTAVQTVFLTLYAIFLAGGIIFMFGRLVSLYLRNQDIEVQY